MPHHLSTKPAPAYPKRAPFFAHRFVRLLFKTCAAQDIGIDACYLLVHIVHTEDAKRYKGPVTFYNDQLRSVLGFKKWERLDRARKAACESGWLHYEPPPTGSRRHPGRYHVLIPGGLENLDDAPIDENTDPGAYPLEGYGPQEAYPSKGYGEGYGEGEPSTLTEQPEAVF